MSKQISKKFHIWYSIVIIVIFGFSINQFQKKQALEELSKQAIALSEQSEQLAIEANERAESQSQVSLKLEREAQKSQKEYYVALEKCRKR